MYERQRNTRARRPLPIGHWDLVIGHFLLPWPLGLPRPPDRCFLIQVLRSVFRGFTPKRLAGTRYGNACSDSDDRRNRDTLHAILIHPRAREHNHFSSASAESISTLTATILPLLPNCQRASARPHLLTRSATSLDLKMREHAILFTEQKDCFFLDWVAVWTLPLLCPNGAVYVSPGSRRRSRRSPGQGSRQFQKPQVGAQILAFQPSNMDLFLLIFP